MARALKHGSRPLAGVFKARVMAAAIVVASGAGAAAAQSAQSDPPADQTPPPASLCAAFAQMGQPPIQLARYAPDLGENEVAITYVGHATFALETPEGVTVATDYAGYAGRLKPPTIVTMNGAHESHFAYSVSDDITHALRGWRDDAAPANHDLQVKDLRVRSVSTDIRSNWGVAPSQNGNSIFVFEVADLCIGHLGHLHYVPPPEVFGAIGFLDVVFAPVDGGYTMSHADMIEVLRNLRARVVIPMHYFTVTNLARFVEGVGGSYEVVQVDPGTLRLSADTLPKKPTMILMPPIFAAAGVLDD